MPDVVKELAAQGRALLPAERVRLLDLLLESLEEPDAPALPQGWETEIERRVAAHERGEGELYEADAVFAEASKIAR